MQEIKIGVVIADKNEYEPACSVLKDYFIADKPLFNKEGKVYKIEKEDKKIIVHIVLAGIGKVNTAVVSTLLLQENDVLINFGYCGGVEGVSRGDILLGTSFIEHDFDVTVFGHLPAEKPGQDYIYYADKELISLFKKVCPKAKEGRIATGDSFVCEETTSDFIKRDLLAFGCDMESSAAAYAANELNKPFLSFKQVSDGAGEDAPEDYIEMNDSYKTSMAEIFKDFLFIL